MDDEAMRAMWPDGRPNSWAPPLHHGMGLVLQQYRPTTILTMPLSESVCGLAPTSVHGGMLATLADIASATSLWEYQKDGSIPVTTDMHIRYYRQPKEWPLKAEVQVVHGGRQLLSTECVITDSQERVLARTTATFMFAPIYQAPS